VAWRRDRLRSRLTTCSRATPRCSTHTPSTVPPTPCERLRDCQKALGEYFTLKDGAGYVARLSYVLRAQALEAEGRARISIDKLAGHR